MDSSLKAITAVFGLLTAVAVFLGALTDQGWLPSSAKDPAQHARPGQQPGGGGGGGEEPTTGTSPPPTRTPPPPTKVGGAYGPDTCIQGYVWREAIPGDHVCVTPEVRDQAAEDNRLADSRRAG
jgi:hypothetical protein